MAEPTKPKDVPSYPEAANRDAAAGSEKSELVEAIDKQNKIEDGKSETVELVEGGEDAVKREITDKAQNGLPYAGTDPEFKRAVAEDL